VAVLLILSSAPAVADPGPPPDGSFVRVTVDGGVSPFSVVAWDVTVRGRTAVVSLVKETPCVQGQRERVHLFDGPAADAVFAELARGGAWAVEAPAGATAGRARERPAPKDVARYEFWVAWGRHMQRFSVDERVLLASPALLGVFVAVRDAVRGRVDALPMRDLYHPAGKIGFLTMTATEPAKAVFDGWDEVPLPVDSLELVDGDHRVVVRGDSGHQREFTVRVVAGQTSQVHVVLE
jgi:hypothetical protein